MQRRWKTVSRQCLRPVCGRCDWCAVSADGVWAICRRVDNGTGLHRVDKSGGEFWLYCLDGHPSHRHSIIELPSQPLVVRADPVTLDRVYRTLLAMLPLSSTHRQALRQRGLPDVEILRRSYRTMPLEGRAALARRVVDRFGPDVCSTIPGLYIATHDGQPYWSIAGAPGLLIPVRNIDGRIVAIKMRADDPRESPKYTYLSSTHHSGPGPGAPVHVSLHALSPEAPVHLTEGELKADVATVLSGVLTIAVPGVSVWRQALPALQDLQATGVLLAFDADWRTNPHVGQALGQAAFALVEAGYRVQVEDWEPTLGKGIDDLLAARHSPVLQSVALAFGASLRGQARQWTGSLSTIAAAEVRPWH